MLLHMLSYFLRLIARSSLMPDEDAGSRLPLKAMQSGPGSNEASTDSQVAEKLVEAVENELPAILLVNSLREFYPGLLLLKPSIIKRSNTINGLLSVVLRPSSPTLLNRNPPQSRLACMPVQQERGRVVEEAAWADHLQSKLLAPAPVPSSGVPSDVFDKIISTGSNLVVFSFKVRSHRRATPC